MDERGFSPRVDMVRRMAQLLLAERTKASSSEPATIGINWARKFVNRHETIKSKYGRKYDYERMQCEDPEVLNTWFRRVQTTIEKYGILTEDIYNFDETGFQMGVATTAKVITSAHMNGRPVVTQPENREWVTT